MIKHFKTGVICLFHFICINAFAQNNGVEPGSTGYFFEVGRYAQILPTGSARYLGIGGATSSLGADIGTIHNNPAGLGFYRKSDMSISTGLNFASTTSTFLGNRENDTRQNFNLPNMGIVFASPKEDYLPGSWRGGAFGISMTRTNNFQNQFRYAGNNFRNSITDYFAESANGTFVDYYDVDQYPGNITDMQGLAYWGYLMDPVDDYNYTSTLNGNPVRQQETVTTKGAQYEWDFAYGGNFDDVFYIGGGIGIASIRYNSEKVFKERILEYQNPSIVENFTFIDNLKIRGTGINFKMGAIYRIGDVARIGINIQSPTYYGMREEYQYQVRTNLNQPLPNGDRNVSEKTLPGSYNYNLTLPARIKAGGSFFAGKSGFLSADIEYVAYNTAKLKGPEPGDFANDNITISNIYKPGININLGGELRKDDLRFRAGFAKIADPFRRGDIDDVNRNIYMASLGAGYRTSDFYTDIAFVQSFFNSNYRPYTLNNGREPVADIRNRNLNIVITVGTTF
ncbi:MAG: OmpP1/FadL family transporter [Cytophagaceae bacterium]